MVQTVQRLPVWFPGAGFKQVALQCGKLAHEVLDIPYEHAVLKSVRYFSCIVYTDWVGNQSAEENFQSMVSAILSKEHSQEEEQAMKESTASSFMGNWHCFIRVVIY